LSTSAHNSGSSTPKAARRRLILGVVAASVGVHAAAAVFAGIWVVVRHFSKQEAPSASVALPAVRIPPPEPERALNPSATAGGAPKAAFADKLQALRPGSISLPSLSKIPPPGVTATLEALPPSDLLAGADLGGHGLPGGGLGGGTGTGVSFLGVQTTSKKVVLMYDVSATVARAAARAGMPMERIRDETATLVANLGVNTRFTLVEFARNYAFFSPTLIPSTKANREAARRWLHTYFAVNGTFPQSTPGAVTGSPGFLVLLEAVFRLQPDTIFIVSDGSMQRGQRGNNTISVAEIEARLVQLQQALPQPAGIFFIGVGVTPENEKALREALLHAGGRGSYTALQR
jgi:hypothetical protein